MSTIHHDVIRSAIAQGESHTTEFKRQIDNPESLAGELVAFANSDGGALYLGVDDDASSYFGTILFAVPDGCPIRSP